jgi:DnaJ-class molecular chaperone
LAGALLGTTVTVPSHPAHPNSLAIPIPAGTQNGEVLDMPGEGLPQKSGGRGVLRITVLITVTASERAALTEGSARLTALFGHVG